MAVDINMDTVKLSKVFEILVLLPFFMATNTMGMGNSSYAPCIQMERDALLKFKEELKDRSNRLASWIDSTDCCKWVGIRCDSLTGHVMELNLANTNHSELKGNLSNSILNLKHISHIDLSQNDFGGIEIPSFLGSLASLKYLDLSSSRFKGMIPLQLGNLSNLQHLGLRGDYFGEPKLLYSEDLDWLQGLRSLSSLDLSMVNLGKVPNWLLEINKLPSLVELYLYNCELHHITPLDHVNFTSLSVLDVSSNNFNTTFPKWILTLSSLVSVNLSFNLLYGPLPIGYSNLTSLESFNIQWNNFNSSLPEWLFSLSSLSYLDIRLNDFEVTISCAFKNLSTLIYLDLSFNYYNSTLPDCFYSLPNLKYVYLMSLDIQGNISHYISNLTNLVHLGLSYNNLIGSTPKSIGTLCNLKIISLEQNKLSGELSEFFYSFSGCLTNSLMFLYLRRNNISGHFSSLPKLRNLLLLDLEYNFLFGRIPESIGNLFSLQYLNLGNNELNGTLPKQLGSMSRLQTIIISYNHMEGIVSEVNFAKLLNLVYLDLSGNSLILNFSVSWVPPFNLRVIRLTSCNSGPKFPNWLKSQNNSYTIDLSNNQISDIVPDWFWRFIPLSSAPYFSYLNLSHNQLSGRIPNIILNFKSIFLGSNKFHGNLPRISTNVSELDLSNNFFSGNLHRLLCHSTRKNNELQILHLGYNNLSGNIPDCWTKWTLLKIVKLDNNNLSGKLPSSIGSLDDLWSLQLRNNNLVGEIPRSLQHCLELRALDLSLNGFNGSIPAWIGTNLTKLLVLGLRSNQFSGSLPNQLCNILFLQIMDIGSNNLTGHIPHCFDKFIAMAFQWPYFKEVSYYVGFKEFFEKAYVLTKGLELEYEKILGLMSSVDLSNNNLYGEIPPNITKLRGLKSLNLSRNHLSGNIPKQIGRMKNMESLDFSRNQLSGQIPQSISEITSLSHLNLSYNNLSGHIPSGTQLQGFDQSSFIGNHLCGPPLVNSCQREGMEPKTEIEDPKEEDDESYIDKWFYLSIAMGFIVGFWGIWGPLLISTTWRHAYFRRLTSLCNKFKL